METENLFQADESVLYKAKKHLIIYIEDAIVHSFGCLLFLIVVFFLNGKGGVLGNAASLLSLMLVLIFYTSYFYAWTKDYFDAWHITDVHIVAVNQKSLLDREVSYMEYGRIQDVFFEKEGLLQTFFGYGRLKVQTAGASQEFVIDGVARVEEVAKKIIELRDGQAEKPKNVGI